MLKANFENGVVGAAVLASDAGSTDPLDVVNTNSPVTYDNRIVATGSKSCKIASSGSAATSILWTTSFGTLTEHYGRFYFNFALFFNNRMVDILTVGGTGVQCGFFISSAGVLSITDQSFSTMLTFATPLSTSTWYRLEYHANTTANSFEAKVFTDINSVAPTETQTKASAAGLGATAANSIRYQSAILNQTLYVDSLVAAATQYPGPVPFNTALPGISGTLAIGSVLTTTDGTWNAAWTYSYQWRRAGVAIAGATANTYTLTSRDVGQKITCDVSATSSITNEVTVASAPFIRFGSGTIDQADFFQ